MELELNTYDAGALRATFEFIFGKSNKTVFNECESSNNCSIPLWVTNLHLNKLLINFGIKSLKINFDSLVKMKNIYKNLT
jgi:hypothetical protein